MLLLGFTVFAVAAAVLPRFPGDLELARAIQMRLSPASIPFFASVALLGQFAVAIPLTLAGAASLWLSGKPRPSLTTLLTIVPDGLNYLIKAAVGRPRPDPELLLLDQSAAAGLSFPSGHAVHFVVFFGFLALALPAWWSLSPAAKGLLWAASLTLILIAGLGRVALGVHWPSDVAGGYLLGVLYLRVLLVLDERLSRSSRF